MKDIKLLILMGLPGSGKTTFAKKYKKEEKGTFVIHMDDVKQSLWYVKENTVKRCVAEGLRKFRDEKCVVVDGLFLTEESIKEVITAVAEFFNKVSVEIHRWNEDRDTCLKNDGGRREVASSITIQNAVYENVDIEKLNLELKDWNTKIIRVIPERVMLKPDWLRFYKPLIDFSEDGKLRSCRWCTGGASGNCWNDSLSPLTPSEPDEFNQLDELLEKICPNITFLHYKKIRKECIEIEDSSESDYYGGAAYYSNWVCDLEKMYEVLKELGYEV